MADELTEALRAAGITRQINYGVTWYVDPQNSTGWADPYVALEKVAARTRRNDDDEEAGLVADH